MKKTVLLLLALVQLHSFSQIIYSESFSNLALQSYTATNGTGAYTMVPSGFAVINDSHNNKIGTTINPNTPFNYSSLKTSGWVTAYNNNVNDTFLVSTSWLDSSSITVDRWVITPPVSITALNTVLRWSAMSPDPNYRDGYEVYATTVTANPTKTDFTIDNLLYSMVDNNTLLGGENTSWTNRSAKLDAYIGKTVRFAFRNNSKDRFQLWLDDIQVATIPTSKDIALTAVEATKYILTNTADSVKVTFTNLGATTATSITLNYMVGNSSVQTQTFITILGWGNSSVNKAVFSLPYNVTSPGYYKIKAWLSAVNGSVDQNTTNDTATFYVTAQSVNVPRTVVMEQFVSANNGDSPDAQEKALALSSSSLIVVNVHHADSFELATAATLISDYKTNSSTAMMDRYYFSDLNQVAISKSQYTPKSSKRIAAVSPASVSIINKAYNNNTNELTFSVKADFVGEVKGDYRINAYLVENNVYGKVSDTTVNGFNQLNNYYSVSWSPYYQKGYFSPTENTYVLSAWLYKQQNVLVHMFGGAYGNPGAIPSTGGTAGQSYQQSYTVTIPTVTNGSYKFNLSNLYIVGFVSEGSSNKNNRTILNGVKDKLTVGAEVIGIEEQLVNSLSFGVYPNPSNGQSYLKLNASELNKQIQLRVTTIFGQTVYESSFYSKNALNELDLEGLNNGAYFMELDIDGHKINKKLIIQH